jgi:hypothetical protein
MHEASPLFEFLRISVWTHLHVCNLGNKRPPYSYAIFVKMQIKSRQKYIHDNAIPLLRSRKSGKGMRYFKA